LCLVLLTAIRIYVQQQLSSRPLFLSCNYIRWLSLCVTGLCNIYPLTNTCTTNSRIDLAAPFNFYLDTCKFFTYMDLVNRFTDRTFRTLYLNVRVCVTSPCHIALSYNFHIYIDLTCVHVYNCTSDFFIAAYIYVHMFLRLCLGK
jgi:hypothetical protein